MGTYECFVGAMHTDNRIFIKEAGEHCQRNVNPNKYGMELRKTRFCNTRDSNSLNDPYHTNLKESITTFNTSAVVNYTDLKNTRNEHSSDNSKDSNIHKMYGIHQNNNIDHSITYENPSYSHMPVVNNTNKEQQHTDETFIQYSTTTTDSPHNIRNNKSNTSKSKPLSDNEINRTSSLESCYITLLLALITVLYHR